VSLFSTSAQPELVEGPSFFRSLLKKREGFDKLSLSGLFLLVSLLAACAAPTPQQSYETGMLAYQEGRLREARIALMNALQADPNHRPARLLQARLFLDAGDGVAAEAELARAHQAGTPPADTRHLMAHARLIGGDAQAALDLAAQAPRQHQAYAQRVVGLAQLARGDQVLAVQAFDRSLALDPRASATWLDVARFRRSLGDHAPALAATDRAVAANPNDGNALVLRGELTRTQYGLAAALPWFDRALEIDPGNLSALLERAATNGDIGRMRAMLADTRAALAIAPNHPLPYFLQATLAARARMFDLSRSLLAKTFRTYDRTPSGMLLGAILAYQTEDFEGAERRLRALVQLQPANMKARRLLAATRWRMNDPAGTIDAVRTIADRPDADTYVLTLVAQALERQGNAAAAARYRQRAALPQQGVRAAIAWSDNSHPDVRAVGELLARGSLDEALVRARALQAAIPGSADAVLLVGDVLAARGDHRAAAEVYRAAANLAFTEAAAIRLIGALDRSGQTPAADGVLRLFAAQNPRNLSGQKMLANRAVAAGRWEEAIGRYETLRARVGNGDAVLLNNLAFAYLQAGDSDRALLFARRAWMLAPGNPATAQTLGWTLYERGDTVQALALLQAAARGRPTEAMVAPTRVAGR
jgi:tetratricopeptide (TPR) repeat protein